MPCNTSRTGPCSSKSRLSSESKLTWTNQQNNMRVNYQTIESEKEALKAVEQDGYASQRPLFLYAGV